MPKVIVWTQAYNAEKTLPNAMESILQQSFDDLAYYVLDNGSQDGTRGVIEAFARRDARVVPLHVEKNDIRNSADFLPKIFRNTTAKWFVWCDADDRYDTSFLEKMVSFAEEHQLEVAACGYRKIDPETGKPMLERVLKTPLLLRGDAFAERFVDYRGFMIFLWAKLYSIDLLKMAWGEVWNKEKRHVPGCDSVAVLSPFRNAERAGVYPEALYNYYQYPASVTHTAEYIEFQGYLEFWEATREYIASYGPISRRNEAFLFAVYLSFLTENLERIYAVDIPLERKLEEIRRMFQEPLTAQMMGYPAPPEFRNLAARGAVIDRVKAYLATQNAAEEMRAKVDEAVKMIDRVRDGGDA